MADNTKGLIAGGLAALAVFLTLKNIGKAKTETEQPKSREAAWWQVPISSIIPDQEFTIPGIDFPEFNLLSDSAPVTVTDKSSGSSFDPSGDFFDFDERVTIFDPYPSDDDFFFDIEPTPEPKKPSLLELFFGQVDVTGTDNTTLDEIYKKYGAAHNVDWKLLKAIAIVESSEDIFAKNPADPSYGLMQIYCETDGLSETEQCKNVFNVAGWESASPGNLYDPDFNVSIAVQILKWNIDNYGLPKAVAVYNSWSARNDPTGGPFRNQEYVNKVYAELQKLQGLPFEQVFT